MREVREILAGGIHPFRSDLFSGSKWFEGKELNKPKGLGHFSCDTPHRLCRGLRGLQRFFGWKNLSLFLLKGVTMPTKYSFQ